MKKSMWTPLYSKRLGYFYQQENPFSATDWHVRNASVHLQKVVIGRPRDRALITQEIGARMTNHNRGFCY